MEQDAVVTLIVHPGSADTTPQHWATAIWYIFGIYSAAAGDKMPVDDH